MTNLEPRAKIGDVVRIDIGKGASMDLTVDFVENLNTGRSYMLVHPYKKDAVISGFKDEHILKNLTTNISYE